MPTTHRHTPECRALLEQISDYIDGELEAKLCVELEHHLADCEDCRVLVDTTQKTLVLYRRQYQQSLVSLSPETTKRLWQTLKEAGCLPKKET